MKRAAKEAAISSESESSESENELEFEQEEQQAASSSSGPNPEDLVQVEFLFKDPSPDHFHSIKQFFNGYLPIPSFNSSNLAELITEQVEVGTMICVDEGHNVYGFITALNLHQYQDSPSIKQIRECILKHCPNDQLKEVEKIMNAPSTGLLLNERMVNMPYQVVPVLHQAVHEDIEWAVENEKNQKLKAHFNFDYFVMVAAKGCQQKSKKGKKEAKVDEADFYYNFENEFLVDAADISFSMEMPATEQSQATKVTKQCTVLFIRPAAHKKAVENFSSMITT